MSYITERVAYLDGLADGLNIKDEKEGKLLRGIIDVLGAIAEELEEQNDTIDDLSGCVDEIYDELDAIDEAFEDDDEDEDEDFDDDDFLEIVCPSCGETIYFDEDMLDSEDGLICPACNEPIDVEVCCCDDCDCDCCGDEDEDEDDEDDKD